MRASPFVFPAASKAGYVAELRRGREFAHAPHALRHTYRSFAIEAGVDLQLVMVLLNHRPPGVTWNYVTRANLTGPMREAAEKVVGVLLSYRGRETVTSGAR